MRPFSFFLCIVALALLLFISSTASAFAQSRSVVVQRRDGDITILTNGDVKVVETWEVQFIGGPFRTAFRSIPLNRVNDITDWSITESGRTYLENSSQSPNTFSVSTEKGEKKISWYFPETTNQTRTFLVSYTLRGALRFYDGGDQFWWKFVEADRGYSINSSRVVVHLPSNFEAAQLKTETYANVSSAGNSRIIDGKTIEFTAGVLSSSTEWEIRAQFPHGIVSASPPAWQVADDQQRAAEEQRLAKIQVNNLYSVFASIVILLGGFAGLLLLWYTRGRDVPTGMIAEYIAQPPEDLQPGVAGTLIDESADLRDIIATIIDLARRGFIQIHVDKFERTAKSREGLRKFEEQVLDELFSYRSFASFGHLTGVPEKLPAIGSSIYRELVDAGYLPENPNKARRGYAEIGIALLMVVIAFGAISYYAVASNAPLAYLPVIAAASVSLGLILLSKYMPRKTKKGAAAAAKWKAFRRYLANVERYAKLEEAKDQFDKYLPYAIAFGLEKSWVNKFAAVNTPAPQWYSGPSVIQIEMSRDDFRNVQSDERSERGSSGGGISIPVPYLSTPQSATESRPSPPSLDEMAQGAFHGLDSISTSFFSALDSAARGLASAPPPAPVSRSRNSATESDRGGGGFFSGWGSGTSSDTWSSGGDSGGWSGGGGGGDSGGGGGSDSGGGGGGSSGFG